MHGPKGAVMEGGEEALKELAKKGFKDNVLMEDPTFIDGVLANYFGARKQLDGYNIWVAYRYDACVPCTRGPFQCFYSWKTGAPSQWYNFERSNTPRWIKCTEGTKLDNGTEMGRYGGQGAFHKATVGDVARCVARAVSEGGGEDHK